MLLKGGEIMNTIPLFDNNTLEQISKILGEPPTSGSQITSIFASVGYNENSNITKWRRIYHYFNESQIQLKSPNKVLELILKFVDPVNFVNNKEAFVNLTSELNKILSFSGLQVNNQGQLIKTTKATTIDQAHQRASNLQKVLYERSIHSDILKFCKAELLQENYFHAVLEATKSVSNKLRLISGVDLDGNKLVIKVFDKNKPLIAINSLQTSSEENEAQGLKNLIMGVFSMFRNPHAHEAKIYWNISEQDAIDLLTTLSFIHRKLDNAVKIPYQ